MKVFFSSILLISCFLFLSGCSKTNRKDIEISPNKEGNLQSQSQKQSQGNVTVKNQMGQLLGDKEGKIISPKKLADFFPEKISGTEKLLPSYGFQYWDSKQFSSASYDYLFSKGGMSIIIQDFGGKKNIPYSELNDFDDKVIESRISTERITIPNGKGYYQWDNNLRTGIISMLIEDRFIVKIDASKLPENALSLTDYFNFIRIDEMVKFAKSIQ